MAKDWLVIAFIALCLNGLALVGIYTAGYDKGLDNGCKNAFEQQGRDGGFWYHGGDEYGCAVFEGPQP